jgi:hypothetical protein
MEFGHYAQVPSSVAETVAGGRVADPARA